MSAPFPSPRGARGIILDRDGTLIDFVRDHERGIVTPAFHPDHIRLLPGVVAGLSVLRDAGFAFAIATNQPDAAKGRLPAETIALTNDALVQRLAEERIEIAQLEVCLHHPEPHDGGDATLTRDCDCRKPKPGMLERILRDRGWQREQCWMIGDTTSDLGAARAAGLRAGLLWQRARCELCVLVGAEIGASAPTLSAPRLDELAELILREPLAVSR